MAAFSIAALQSEITNDPVAMGYSSHFATGDVAGLTTLINSYTSPGAATVTAANAIAGGFTLSAQQFLLNINLSTGLFQFLNGDGNAKALAATAGVVRAVPCRLLSVLVTTLGTAAGVLYDNASAASGTEVGIVPASAAVGSIYLFNTPCANGIYYAGGANSPALTVGYGTPQGLAEAWKVVFGDILNPGVAGSYPLSAADSPNMQTLLTSMQVPSLGPVLTSAEATAINSRTGSRAEVLWGAGLVVTIQEMQQVTL
jgi:hypothetical protein